MTNVKTLLLSGAAALALVGGPVAAQTADLSTDTEVTTGTTDNGVVLENQTDTTVEGETLVDRAAEATGDAVDATGEALSNGADAATDMARDAGEAIENGAEATADAASDTGDAIAEEASDLQQNAEAAMDNEADADADVTAETDVTGSTTDTQTAAVEVEAGSMVGSEVLSSAGENIGEINQFIRVNDQVMAVVGVGGFLGLGQHEVALPLSDLDVEGENVTAFGYTKEQLKSMAEYDSETAQAVEDEEIVGFGKS